MATINTSLETSKLPDTSRGVVLQLVRPALSSQPDQELLEKARWLLSEVMQGKITGLAVVADRGETCDLISIGSCAKRPCNTLSALQDLSSHCIGSLRDLSD